VSIVRVAIIAALLLGARAAGAAAQAAPAAPAPTPPAHDYLVFVASEGNDQIALVRFGPKGARVERVHTIGTNRTELVGPHGIAVSPDGRWYYVTTAHGTPNGAMWKYSTANDSLAGRVELGRFPATVTVSPNGQFAWTVNFNLYGDMVTSTVSVVYAGDMAEVKRIPTCIMPHGSRLAPDGKHQYSACMMNDALVEIDADQMAVSRHFTLTKGSEMGASGPVPADMKMGAITCSPTWAQPSVDGKTVWVACNKSNDIVEIDLTSWTMWRRIPAGDGIYNLATSHDGKLLVGTNKRGKSVSVIDVKTGKELARIATTRRVPSGLVISPDDRYAFITLEGVGSEPGTVDIIDLHSLVRVASVDVGQQAGGVDFWKSE
jgi:DNA-binding beta-propeller fold protein YncE